MVAGKKHLLLVLILALTFSSLSAAFGAPASAFSVYSSVSVINLLPNSDNTVTKASVVKKGSDYYYNDPHLGGIRKKAGFVTFNGNRYYVQNGGKIVIGRTFTVGKKQYRAWANGKIAVGAYRWYDKKCYFSNPRTGEWLKKEQFVWWNGNRYYIQPNTTLAANKGFII